MSNELATSPAPNGAGLGVGIPGTVYLLCIDAPGLHVTGNRYARHYLGWTEGDVDARVRIHLAGQGSPLIRAAVNRGLGVKLVRVWTEADRNFERKLKRRREAPRLCPTCSGDASVRRAS